MVIVVNILHHSLLIVKQKKSKREKNLKMYRFHTLFVVENNEVETELII
jgi:hypothetical protein